MDIFYNSDDDLAPRRQRVIQLVVVTRLDDDGFDEMAHDFAEDVQQHIVEDADEELTLMYVEDLRDASPERLAELQHEYDVQNAPDTVA